MPNIMLLAIERTRGSFTTLSPHWLAFLAIRRVYRWSPEEVWLGYSRIVWLTVVPCAYFLGLADLHLFGDSKNDF